ncbi:hypothetical protein CLTEP_23880 [Clostridium tepidiprofundi DSM 19306]|uniref:LXG domain-containing protein n=1 Tax=Clostridium tepidiprofundi DSM 19306 TaxID=1121338 RepID=A0A151AV00_9CLOT|nr:glycine zipper family protein [Clostridium tepidiprofundi]KYH31392.1 hypothetical protein CLTEP_23880 [Clostridium tepidiprofundi DSM 19306]
MSEQENNGVLLIDDSFRPLLTVNDVESLKPIQKKFMESYIIHKDIMSIEEWLPMELQVNLPKKSDEEIKEISSEIITTIKLNEEKKHSLEQAIKNGRSKESWFASETKKAMSHMSAQEAAKYLQNLDNALCSVNNALYETIVTQNGTINLNPQLDGFIAEQYHAQTFNLNAEATNSQYRAKVLKPEGQGYAKNSVDIVIVDGNGKVVRRYQSKYCKNADSTLHAFKKGDYRGQRKLVPDGQETYIKNATSVIESPDGTTSNPLSKQSAKELQKEAQSGKWNDLNWSEYKAKDLAMGIGKQAGQVALMGAAIGVGFNVAQKVWEGETIEKEEIIETALESGADFGIKAATAGAIKVGAEKGLISVIPKGTPAGTIANIAHVGIENVKVVGKIATGELTLKEGFDKMEQVTVSTVAGITTSVKGAAIGATIGTVFGPVGTAVGGFIGGTVGYMAGSKVGETVAKGVQKVREVAKNVVKSIGNTIKSGISSICSGIKSLLSW